MLERHTGDELLYEVTVDHPDVLLQSWRQNPVLMTKAVAGGGFGSPTLIGTEPGNREAYDGGDITSQIRH